MTYSLGLTDFDYFVDSTIIIYIYFIIIIIVKKKIKNIPIVQSLN